MAYPIGTYLRNHGKVDGGGPNYGKCGVVTGHDPCYRNLITDDDGATGVGEDIFYEVVIKNKKSLMQTISTYAKRLLDGDTKTLIKAGFLNSDLSPTDKGFRHINAFLFDKYKAEIVEVAKEVIAEEKADKE